EFFNFSSNSSTQIPDKDWNSSFIKWFRTKVAALNKDDSSIEMEDLLSLSRGPSTSALCYKGYIINGYRFHTKITKRL
ncbi:hypothetical protein LINPERPRIM_LOCUS21187, partial [Linum perenne]